jgi:hypothetical protein
MKIVKGMLVFSTIHDKYGVVTKGTTRHDDNAYVQVNFNNKKVTPVKMRKVFLTKGYEEVKV